MKTAIPNNEIWYTTTDEQIVGLDLEECDFKVISNTYKDGKGVIVANRDIVTIGGYMFSVEDNVERLCSVVLPQSVTTIDWRAFAFCCALECVELPNGLVIIGSNAFMGCSSLKSITIPNSVKEIGEEAFLGCSNLVEFNCSLPNYKLEIYPEENDSKTTKTEMPF